MELVPGLINRWFNIIIRKLSVRNKSYKLSFRIEIGLNLSLKTNLGITIRKVDIYIINICEISYIDSIIMMIMKCLIEFINDRCSFIIQYFCSVLLFS